MRRAWAAILVPILVPVVGHRPALAQEVAAEEGPKVQEIKAVERGFFFETDVGVGFIVNPIDDKHYRIPAPIFGLFVGYDIIDILNISVGAELMAASTTYDVSDPGPQGDLLFLIPQLRVQFAVLTTERNFLWIRAHGGFGVGLPGSIEVAGVDMDHGGNGPTFGGSIGFERFTKLRHFSLGAHAGVDFVTQPGFAVAISVLPMVKYTF